jgi:hypothetical protein
MAQTIDPITKQAGDIGAQNEAVYQQDVLGAQKRAERMANTSGNTTTNIVNKAPVAPVITAESLKEQSPVVVPTTPTPTTATSITGQTESILEQYLAQQQQQAQKKASQSESDLLSLQEDITGVQQSRSKTEADLKIPELAKQSNDAFTALQASQRAQTKAIRELEKNPQGLFGGALQQEIQRVNREYAMEQADLAITYDVANRNYTSAQATADRKIALALEPLQTKIQFQTAFYNANQQKLSTAQQNTLQALITKNERQYNEERETLKTISTLAIDSAKGGAPADIAQKIQNSRTIAEALNLASSYMKPVQTSLVESGGRQLLINSQTGDTIRDLGSSQRNIQKVGTDDLGNDIYGFYDQNSNSIVQVSNQTVGSTNTSKGVVGGYDISSYATDPLHEQKVANILANIGQFKSAEDINGYIKRKYPDSKITGEMVINASSKSGVSWEMVVAMMEQDSSLGTKGLGAKNNNPGNIGQFDSLGTQGVKGYATLQQGVDAVANWLGKHKSDAYQPTINSQELYSIANAASNLVGAERGKTSNKAIKEALNKNDFVSAYAQVANNVEESLTGDVKTKFANARTDYQVMQGMRDAIEKAQNAGLDTSFLKGTAEQIQRKFGSLATDPRYAVLAVQLEREFQSYRQNMTGAAFSPGESREYGAVNPRTTASLELNLATIDGALNQLENRITSTVNTRIPGAQKLYLKSTGEAVNPAQASVGDVIEYGGKRYQKIGDNQYQEI